jgi:hypothetical protein
MVSFIKLKKEVNMRWLKGILVFTGLKLVELALAAFVCSIIYLIFTLTPAMAIFTVFLISFLLCLSYLFIMDEPYLMRLYWYNGPLMKVVGVVTVAASIPVVLSILAKLFFYVGCFYNWLASLVGIKLVDGTYYWMSYSAAGFAVSALGLIVFILLYIWIGNNIDKTRKILDKWEKK